MKDEGSPASTNTGSKDRSLTQMISRARRAKRKLAYQSPRRLVGSIRSEGTSASRPLRSLRVQRMISTYEAISWQLDLWSRPRRKSRLPTENPPCQDRLEYHMHLEF